MKNHSFNHQCQPESELIVARRALRYARQDLGNATRAVLILQSKIADLLRNEAK